MRKINLIDHLACVIFVFAKEMKNIKLKLDKDITEQFWR